MTSAISSPHVIFLKRKSDRNGVGHVEMWVGMGFFFDTTEKADVFELKQFCPSFGT
jgi:hypothetical protein